MYRRISIGLFCPAVHTAGFFHGREDAMNEHILVDDETERNAKLALVKASKTVIANCLSLLGIAAPERM